MSEIDIVGSIGSRARRDDNCICSDLLSVIDLQCVRVDETSVTFDDFDTVSIIETAPHRLLFLNDRLGTSPKVSHRRVGFDSRLTKQLIAESLCKLCDRETKSLTWDGSPMGAATADPCVLFNNKDIFARFRQLHRGAFAAGARTDHDHICFS